MVEQKTRPAGLEPATYGLEIRCSVRLSYGRKRVSRGAVGIIAERYTTQKQKNQDGPVAAARGMAQYGRTAGLGLKSVVFCA